MFYRIFAFLAPVILIVLASFYLRMILNLRNSQKYLSLSKWIILTYVALTIGIFVGWYFFPSKLANLIEHGVGGGVVSGLIYMHIREQVSYKFNFWIDGTLAFMATCTLGVMNEMAEYMMESLGIGIYSLDTHDVWRDFLANSLGFLAAWILIVVYKYKKLQKNH